MRGPQPPAVSLSKRQANILQRLTRQRTASQQLVTRARLILLAANGENNDQIGKQLGLDRGRVRIWRKRWLASAPRLAAQEEADQDNKDDKQLTAMIHDLLADVPRPGTTPKFSAEQVVQIVALACEDPQHCGRPVSHWTPRELADEATKRGIVQAISPSSVGRFLKSGRSQATSVPLLAARQTRRPV